MIKVFSTLVLALLLGAVGLSSAHATTTTTGGIKIYSGYFQPTKPTIWHGFFDRRVKDELNELSKRHCSIEFTSPISFSHQPVTDVPKEITYLIKFDNGPRVFENFTIKIDTNDDQVETIDPWAQGKQVAIDERHKIGEAYLIYLLLSSDHIKHLEIVGSEGEDHGKYVLDNVQVRETHSIEP